MLEPHRPHRFLALCTLTLVITAGSTSQAQDATSPWPEKPTPKSKAYQLTGKLYSADWDQLDQAILDAEQHLASSARQMSQDLDDLHAALEFASTTRQEEFFARGKDHTTTRMTEKLDDIVRLYSQGQYLDALKQLGRHVRGKNPDKVVAIFYQGMCEKKLAEASGSGEDIEKRLKKSLAYFTTIERRHPDPYRYDDEIVQARALYESYLNHRSLWQYYKKLSKRDRHVRGNALSANTHLRLMKQCRERIQQEYPDAAHKDGSLFADLVAR